MIEIFYIILGISLGWSVGFLHGLNHDILIKESKNDTTK